MLNDPHLRQRAMSRASILTNTVEGMFGILFVVFLFLKDCIVFLWKPEREREKDEEQDRERERTGAQVCQLHSFYPIHCNAGPIIHILKVDFYPGQPRICRWSS